VLQSSTDRERAVSAARRIVHSLRQDLVGRACRALGAVGVAGTALSLSGCYSLVAKTPSQVMPGGVVVAEISDVGRVALVPQIGSEVAGIQGQVFNKSDSTVELKVSQVRFLSGVSSPWQGQQATLRTQDIKSLKERTFSRRRSMIAAAAMAGMALIAITAAGFAGVFNGDGGPDKGTEPPPSK